MLSQREVSFEARSFWGGEALFAGSKGRGFFRVLTDMLILKPLSSDGSVAGAKIPAATFTAQAGYCAFGTRVHGRRTCSDHGVGPTQAHGVFQWIYIYIYIYVYTHTHIYIYIYNISLYISLSIYLSMYLSMFVSAPNGAFGPAMPHHELG